MEMVVNGVSSRKVRKITEKLCGREFKKSAVNDLTKDLNEQVQISNQRPLDEQECPFLFVHGMQLKVRRQGQFRAGPLGVQRTLRRLEGKADRALETLELSLLAATTKLRPSEKYRHRVPHDQHPGAAGRGSQTAREGSPNLPERRVRMGLVGAIGAEPREDWSTRQHYFAMHKYRESKQSFESDGEVVNGAAE